MRYGGDEIALKLNKKLNVKGGIVDGTKLSENNIGVVSDGTDTLNVKLAKALTNLNSITMSACIEGHIQQDILNRNENGAYQSLERLVRIFGKEDFYLEIQNHGLPEEALVCDTFKRWASQYGLKLVATNDFHYLERADAAAQEVKLCISTGSNLEDPSHFRFSNDEFYMAIVTIEDFTLPITVVVFPKTYEKYRNLIAADMAIAVRGRADINDESVQVMCLQIRSSPYWARTSSNRSGFFFIRFSWSI